MVNVAAWIQESIGPIDSPELAVFAKTFLDGAKIALQSQHEIIQSEIEFIDAVLTELKKVVGE